MAATREEQYEDLAHGGKRLADRVTVIVGGGGAALGRATARRFHAEGAHVVCADRVKDSDAGSAMVEELGERASAVGLDIMDHEQYKAMLEGVVAEFGRLDVLFNLMVAGRTPGPQDWEYTLTASFGPTYFGTLYGAELMSRGGGGSIINTSSDAGIGISGKFRPLPPITEEEAEADVTIGQGSYGAAKAGVWHFTKEMAMRYARRGVRVNCISPGYMATPLTLNNIQGAYRDQVTDSIPMGHFGQAEDVAAAVAFFASDDSRYLTGHLITVDGGYSVWGPR